MIINQFDNSLAMVCGDDEQLTVAITGDYTYHSGDSVTLSVKRHVDDETALFSRSAAVSSSGTGTIAILKADTKNAEPGVYFYDIQLTMSTDVKTIVPLSKFTLIPEVTA